MPTIGDILRIFRATKNISQKELAENLNISTNFLSQLENNKKNISLTKINDIANYLGVSKDLLILTASTPPPELNKKKQSEFIEMQQNLMNYILNLK